MKLMTKARQNALLPAVCAPLASCSATSTCDNAHTALRFMASSYLDLGRALAETFEKPELRRSEEFIREDRRWDSDLGRLIVDLDRSLSVEQRSRVVQRLSGYAEDFAALAGEKKEAV